MKKFAGHIGFGIIGVLAIFLFCRFMAHQQDVRNAEVFTVTWPGHSTPVTVQGADSLLYNYGSLSFSDGRTEYQCVQDAEIVRIR